MLRYSLSSKTYSLGFSRAAFYDGILLWNQIFKTVKNALMSPKSSKLYLNQKWGQKTPFLKVLIIRGIGYRGFITPNDLNGDGREMVAASEYINFLYSDNLSDFISFSEEFELNCALWYDVASAFFLTLRAGHTNDANWKVLVHIKNIKKNRKLVLFGKHKSYVNYIANSAWQYRKPSVYTGRGIRKKGVRVIRKAGKRDQKGRGF